MKVSAARQACAAQMLLDNCDWRNGVGTGMTSVTTTQARASIRPTLSPALCACCVAVH